MSKTRVNIHRLKNFALNKLPKDWALREILLCERDELGASEFIAKVDVWLKLAQGEHSTSSPDN